MPEILTVAEASQYLRLRPATIYTYCETGRLPHLKVGSRILLEKTALQEWVAAHRVPALKES